MKHFQNGMLLSKLWLIVTGQVDGIEAVTKTIEHSIKHRRRTSAPLSLGTRTCRATAVQGCAQTHWSITNQVAITTFNCNTDLKHFEDAMQGIRYISADCH